MYYIVQENVFKDDSYFRLFDALDRLGLEYEIVTLPPFIENFEFQTKRKDVFPFGAVKMSRLSKKFDWYPGSQLCENHDYEVYSKYYKDNLLNYDSEIVRFGDDIIRDGRFFARPTEDTKIFTGQVFDMYTWREFKKERIKNNRTSILTEDTKIQISSVKKIQKEIRFWIVKGEPVTASQYTLGGNFHLDDIIDDDAYDYVRKMIKIFELNETFTMDICLVNGEYKIVECGCVNSAGFYKADLIKLLISLENAFN